MCFDKVSFELFFSSDLLPRLMTDALLSGYLLLTLEGQSHRPSQSMRSKH